MAILDSADEPAADSTNEVTDWKAHLPALSHHLQTTSEEATFAVPDSLREARD